MIVKPEQALAQTSNLTGSAPAIQWQKEYGGGRTESVSNLIQTSDGGYAFLDLGWSHGVTPMTPSTFYKVDSSGNLQWTKTLDWFTAINLTQTSDGGYEISGHWNTYGTTGIYTPTLIKTDSKGNVQWYENSSSSESPLYPSLDNRSLTIQTSDGGFASLRSNRIIKTDSNGTEQWVNNLVFPPVYGISFNYDSWTSMIETKDGALAVIGVASLGATQAGNIYLIKTEAFLPLPSPTQLPTPISTPLIISKSVLLAIILAIALTVVAVAVVAVLLVYFKKHKR